MEDPPTRAGSGHGEGEAVAMVFRWQHWVRPLAGAAAVAAAFQVLTLGQPPVGAGAPRVAALIAMLWASQRR